MVKRLVGILGILVLLSGCAKPDAMEEALAFRARVLAGCSFRAAITADYDREALCFDLECRADENGDLTFQILAPASIQGISGQILADSGKLTFDDFILGFPLLAEDRLSPAAAPGLFAQLWRSGYISLCGYEDNTIRMTAKSGFDAHALTLETWLDSENKIPIFAELCYNNQSVLRAAITEFQFT